MIPGHRQFIRGDCNGDGKVDISDGVFNLNFLFGGDERSDCAEACNTNGDAKNDISDPVSLFNFLFAAGPGPGVPFPECGEGPREEIPCVESTCGGAGD